MNEINDNLETARLKTLATKFDIPINTLRVWASKGTFPGILKKGRAIYVDMEKFREWWFNKKSRRS